VNARRLPESKEVEARRFRELARYASDVVLIVDTEARVKYLSPSAERLMGYREDEWLGRSGLEVFHPDDAELAMGAFARTLASPGLHEPLEARIRKIPDGWRWFELVATNLIDHPDIRGIVICARDITDLRSAHDEISAGARRFEMLLANLSDLVAVIDARGNMTYVSPITRQLLGRLPEDRVGASIFDYIHPDDVVYAAGRLREARSTPGLVQPFEVRTLHEDGTYRVFEVRANNLLDDPDVNGIIVTSRDITDRVAAEAALHESERLYRKIVETADEGIWMIDADSVTTFVNRRMSELLGVSAAEMIGRSIFEFVSVNGRQSAAEAVELRRAGIADQRDVEILRDDGTAFWAMVSSSPFLGSDGTYEGAIALVTDITERRRAEADLREAALRQQRHDAEMERHQLEAELAQVRRLESLGRLAAGVAHDFNNLLGVILNYASVAAKQLGADSPAAGDITQIQRAAEQAADVTQKLLTFGRADAVNPEIVDLNNLVKNVTHLVDRSFGAAIRVETRLAGEGCLVHADRGQLEQLLMNLLVNARDALTEGGTITVTTLAADDNRREVTLLVADNGVGMSPHTLQHAFEPFFTTKTAEHGSGLGLATVHATVDRAHGHVSIESEPAIGTTVRVRLPAGSQPIV
jgi:two-component system cell cycle sensor histidine kinase/response regulator CckA